MFSYLILGVAVLVGFLLLLRAFANASAAAVAELLRWTLIAVACVTGVIFILTGRPVLTILSLLLALVALTRRLWPVTGGGKRGRGRRGGSNIETSYLRLHLDHASGSISGTVLQGQYEGRYVEELPLGDLIELLKECRVDDPDGARLLEAYLDRAEASWRETMNAGDAGDGRRGKMSRVEAREVLGVLPGASDEEVREAHRRLMREHHPDRGGSTEFAARVNEAKEVLLAGG